ncbi:MAG: YidC/Oxa1 family membrane protein insertase [Oscillospiraceae bacterium]|nr:YidC/Oxa1 family membrane protein insertase [Oscillospiraceae bacterium]
MSFGSMLYRLLIGPLELFFEVVFSLADHVLHDPGLSIIALSLAMNFLVLPLYRRADILQARQRDRELALKPWVDHIKKTFSGDERFMILQTYYRQNGYKQTDALKGSVSLLLEVPFFIAAYRFLSGLALLQGVPFGPIRDLGAPDGLLQVGGTAVNVLPILMTVINLISAAIYLKGFPLKDKLQMTAMALIFLVLLYGSPAGLVFYWTLNNIFSLCKNIFYKLRRPGRALSFLAAGAGLALLALALLRPLGSAKRTVLVILFALALQLPLALELTKGRRKTRQLQLAGDGRLFLYASLFLTVLTGLLIPAATLGASPEEFVFLGHYRSPAWYLVSSALIAAGTFLIWLRIFYELAGEKARAVMDRAFFALALMAAIDYLFFGTGRGNLSAVLIYSVVPEFPARDALINALVLALALPLALWIRRKAPALIRTALLAALIAALGMSAASAAKIPAGLRSSGLDYGMVASTEREDWPRLTLSREGQNVVVIMLDRADGYLLPYIFTERPELQRQFDGFTYYPDTLTHGSSTREGAPSLFGGYGYLPEELDADTTRTLVQKHNDALRVMPLLFSGEGYRVSVIDPAFAGYRWYPDLSIYADHPEICASNTYGRIDGSALTAEQRQWYCEGYFGWQERNISALMRNFFCYSLFRSAPVFLQPTLYNNGFYNAAAGLDEADATALPSQLHASPSEARGLDPEFVNCYDVLPLLSEMTWLEEDIPGAFVMMVSDVTHSPCLLQTPDYVPSAVVDDRDYDAAHSPRLGFDGWEPLELDTVSRASHYHVMMSTMIQLGRWLDWLRSEGVYDNTRIIIVSDHGTYLDISPEVRFGSDWWEDITLYNALLMVKDFSSQGFTVDERFMTNADVPLLATDSIIADSCDPATGLPLTDAAKYRPVHMVYRGKAWNDIDDLSAIRLPSGAWYAFRGEQLYDIDAWILDHKS